MMLLGKINEWSLFECSDKPGEKLRVAYDGFNWYHVCDSITQGWDPDPMIPQCVIDIHLSLCRYTERA